MDKILVLKGDGIGPEIIDATILVMEEVKNKLKLSFIFDYSDFGGIACEKFGKPFTEETKEKIKGVKAILLGSVGGPQYEAFPRELRPEMGLLEIRQYLGLYSNIRPVTYYNFLHSQVAIKKEVAEGTDFVILRELTGGIYFGEKKREGDFSYDRMEYHKNEIERIVRDAFSLARQRKRKKLTSVDKANVLETSRLWREVTEEVHKDYPEITLEHLYVDNAAIQLIINPTRFDVIVTENSFGDILSDEAAALTGSLGMLPSASLGGEIGLYEPAHGSAPDIAGKGIANPVAAILSSALLFRFSLNNETAAKMIENAVNQTLRDDIKTRDIAGKYSKIVGTQDFAKAVIERL